MMALVTYDVATGPGGLGRLRRVAKACRDFGQRVQFSVFEIEVDPAQWAALKNRLSAIIDAKTDSLRFYQLGANWQRRIEHVGAKQAADLNGPLIVCRGNYCSRRRCVSSVLDHPHATRTSSVSETHGMFARIAAV